MTVGKLIEELQKMPRDSRVTFEYPDNSGDYRHNEDDVIEGEFGKIKDYGTLGVYITIG